MAIYVNSRGRPFDDDYEWHEVLRDNEQKNEPANVEQLYRLIQSTSRSLVLGRFDGNLILFVTGLEALARDGSTARTDIGGTQIRNTVLWQEIDTDETEKKIRQLAASALKDRDWLQETIHQSIKFNINPASTDEPAKSRLRFITDYHGISLDALLESAPIREVKSEDPKAEDEILAIEENSYVNLSEELANRRLPGRDERQGALVVVTKVQDFETLEDRRVWRGLCEPPKNSSANRKSKRKIEQNEEEKKKDNLVLPTLVAVMAATLTMISGVLLIKALVRKIKALFR